LVEAAAAGDPYRVVLIDQGLPEMHSWALARAISTDPRLAPVRLAALTRRHQRVDAVGAAAAGLAEHLAKPVRLLPLQICLLRLLGAQPVTDRAASGQSGSRLPAAALSSGWSGAPPRVLVAEDNAVNQKLAVRLLEKQGCQVEIAATGQTAVTAWERGGFDLIFMDCHMPELNGYEATRMIRALEASRGLPPTRIVAMTANALQGDREECLRAGMDDYIAKPVTPDSLGALLARNLREVRSGRPSTLAP
jgi:CheY-like chemotaxis protein